MANYKGVSNLKDIIVQSELLQLQMAKGKKKATNNKQINKMQEEVQIFESPHSRNPQQNENPGSPDSYSQEQLDIQEQNEEQEDFVGKRENTLSILTKRFTKLIKSKQNFVLDINEATRELGVQKRRIYDITNVLQGIGYIQKIHKNKMKWIGGTMDLEIAKEVASLDQKIQEYSERSRFVQQQIIILTHKLKRETEEKKDLNYLLQEDLKQILDNLEGDPGSMMLIKAQEGSVIELRQNAIVIQNTNQQHCQMSYVKLLKKQREDCFSIIK